jgi:hypothetical protein
LEKTTLTGWGQVTPLYHFIAALPDFRNLSFDEKGLAFQQQHKCDLKRVDCTLKLQINIIHVGKVTANYNLPPNELSKLDRCSSQTLITMSVIYSKKKSKPENRSLEA